MKKKTWTNGNYTLEMNDEYGNTLDFNDGFGLFTNYVEAVVEGEVLNDLNRDSKTMTVPVEIRTWAAKIVIDNKQDFLKF